MITTMARGGAPPAPRVTMSMSLSNATLRSVSITHPPSLPVVANKIYETTQRFRELYLLPALPRLRFLFKGGSNFASGGRKCFPFSRTLREGFSALPRARSQHFAEEYDSRQFLLKALAEEFFFTCRLGRRNFPHRFENILLYS